MNDGTLEAPVEILVVEDNPVERDLMIEALLESNDRAHVHTAQDGIEAMAFLRREGDYASAPRPDLILLDLNLPKKDGRTLLAEIKADLGLMDIAVIVVSTSSVPQDVEAVYSLHADAYITKPQGVEGLFKVVKSIYEIWKHSKTLPKRGANGLPAH